jgi:hypothetical protein
MILLFLDVFTGDTYGEPDSVWMELIKALLAGLGIAGGILLEKRIERRREERNKITSVLLINKIIPNLIERLKKKTSDIHEIGNGLTENPFGKHYDVPSFKFDDFIILDNINPNELYNGYLIVYGNHNNAINDYTELQKCINSLKSFLSRLPSRYRNKFRAIYDSKTQFDTEIVNIRNYLFSMNNKYSDSLNEDEKKMMKIIMDFLQEFRRTSKIKIRESNYYDALRELYVHNLMDKFNGIDHLDVGILSGLAQQLDATYLELEHISNELGDELRVFATKLPSHAHNLQALMDNLDRCISFYQSKYTIKGVYKSAIHKMKSKNQ